MINHIIEIGKTKFGSRVMVIKNSGLPLEAASVWFPAGSRNDPVGKEGLAHFFEHLLMSKTENFPTRTQRLEKIEENGMYYNAFTEDEVAHYYFIESPEKTLQALSLLVDGINNFLITEDDVEKEKPIILNEEMGNRSNPQSYIWRLAKKAMWPKDRIGHDLYGDTKSIESINLGDMNSFLESQYDPRDASFIIVSGENVENIIRHIDEHGGYNHLTHKQRKPIPGKFSPPAPILIDKRDLGVTTISISFRTCPLSNPDWLPLKLLSGYLASGWISRLVQRLRIEQEITYWVNGFSNNFTDTGYITFVYSVQISKIDTSMKICSEEFENLRTNLIPDRELNKHKAAFKAQFLRFNALDPGSILSWYGWQAMTGKETLSMNDFLKKIEEIKPSDIKEVAERYLVKNNQSIAIIGDIVEIS